MQEFLVFYILGALITSNILGLWFESGIFLHVISAITRKKFFVLGDLVKKIESRHPVIAELIECVWCLGFWVSLFVAISILLLTSEGILFILACSFSWPLLAAKVFKIGN